MPNKGKAIVWTERDLNELSQVSPAEIERAAIFWRKHAPKEARDILDADTDDISVE